MRRKSYEEGLQLQTLKIVIGRKKKYRRDVFKICKGFNRIKPSDLFSFDDNAKGSSVKRPLSWTSQS